MNLAVLLKLADDGLHGLGRHRKADADRAAGGRDDRGVDADHFAFEIEQRAARVAAIDGGVGLDVVVIGAGIDVAVARRHDAGGDRAAQAERVADGDDPFAEAKRIGVAELHRLERLGRLDPQHCQIGLLILADNLGLEPRAVGQDHVDLVGFGDHVVVGDDDAGRIDDEAGTERTDPARRAIGGLLIVATLSAAVLEEFLEELLERRTRRQIRRLLRAAARATLDLLRGRDVDHGIDHFFGNIGDGLGAACENGC